MLRSRVTLFRVAGIAIRIDASWLFLAVLVTWSLAVSFFPAQYRGLLPRTYWTMGAIGAVGLFASILFHHGNLRLPQRLERVLVRLIVTPRMHGIHHSDRLNETDSNWSSLLSAWDYLHRTILLDVPQPEITIGVPAYGDPSDVTLGKMLLLPFRRQRRDWERP